MPTACDNVVLVCSKHKIYVAMCAMNTTSIDIGDYDIDPLRHIFEEGCLFCVLNIHNKDREDDSQMQN